MRQRTTWSEAVNLVSDVRQRPMRCNKLIFHLLTRNTKDVAPCFSPKKREKRSSD
jgi:hypothetical protein